MYKVHIYSSLTQALSNISSHFPATIDRLVISTVPIGFDDGAPVKDSLLSSICHVLFGESIEITTTSFGMLIPHRCNGRCNDRRST